MAKWIMSAAGMAAFAGIVTAVICFVSKRKRNTSV